MNRHDSRRSKRPAPAPGRGRALVGFAAFGWIWGTFAASLPAVNSHADVTEGALGIALLCVGMGALTSMRPMGAIVDRFGRRVLPASVLVFAATAFLPAVAGSAFTLSGALLLLGAGSGAVDVALNAEGVRTEENGPPLMNLAHALFSAGVVGASLLTRLLRRLDADLAIVLGATSAALATVALLLFRLDAARYPRRRPRNTPAPCFTFPRPWRFSADSVRSPIW